jgi:ATP-dependent Clp protease ATP-binding subunit ClpC
VDAADLRKTIEQNLAPGIRKNNNLANIPLVKQAEKTLKLTYLEAKTFKSVQIGTEHLLLCILKESDNIVTKTLLRYGVDYDAARAELEAFLENPGKIENSAAGDEDDADETN